MRLALLAGRKHGQKNLAILVAPADPRTISDAFKEILGAPGDLAEIQLWDSHAGISKKKHFAATGAPASIEEEDEQGEGEEPPTIEEARRMVERIEQLENLLAAARAGQLAAEAELAKAGSTISASGITQNSPPAPPTPAAAAPIAGAAAIEAPAEAAPDAAPPVVPLSPDDDGPTLAPAADSPAKKTAKSK